MSLSIGFREPDELRCRAAGFGSIDMAVQQLNLELPKLEEFVPRHISATPMAAGFAATSPIARQEVIRKVAERLKDYDTQSGLKVPLKLHLVKALKQ